MAITKRAPNTILIGGGGPAAEGAGVYINDLVAGVAITPGMLIETYDDAGTTKWRPHTAAADVQPRTVALEQLMNNRGVDYVYAVGDLVQAIALYPGSVFWGIVANGQDISNQEPLQSNGDGRLKAATVTTAAGNVAHFKAHDALGAVAAHTRCRVEVQ